MFKRMHIQCVQLSYTLEGNGVYWGSLYRNDMFSIIDPRPVVLTKYKLLWCYY